MVVALLAICIASMETAYGAEKNDSKAAWNISFLGALPVPAQMEIIDIKDVLIELSKLNAKTEEQNPPKDNNLKKKVMSPEEIAAVFETYNIGVYEFAIKNNGTYNTALAFAGKAPAQMNANGIKFFNRLQTTSKQQQKEIHMAILKGIDEVYAKKPDLKNVFELEILEFYPFEHISNKNVEIISIGGSMAIRTFKLIQPAAFKVYFINKNAELYIFAVINSGLDRKMWDQMSQDMLTNAQWNDYGLGQSIPATNTEI